jgi:Tfp pilus assembly protein PilO
MLIPTSRFRNINYILIIIVVCFIGVVIFGSNLLLPKFQELKDLNKRIEEKRNEIKYREEYFAKLTEVKNELEKYKEELSKIDSALPNDSFLPTLFSYLQKTIPQSGLVLKDLGSFTVSPSEKYPDIKEITLNLGVSGPYSSFKNFLSTLEKSTRMIEIESISFSNSQEQQAAVATTTITTTKDIFNFNLAIKAYSY